MDGVPIGRKVDLNAYDGYEKLCLAVKELFKGFYQGTCFFTYLFIKKKQEEEEGTCSMFCCFTNNNMTLCAIYFKLL